MYSLEDYERDYNRGNNNLLSTQLDSAMWKHGIGNGELGIASNMLGQHKEGYDPSHQYHWSRPVKPPTFDAGITSIRETSHVTRRSNFISSAYDAVTQYLYYVAEHLHIINR